MNSNNLNKDSANHVNDKNGSNVHDKPKNNNKNSANAKKKKSNAKGFHVNGTQVNQRSTHSIGFLPPGVAHR